MISRERVRTPLEARRHRPEPKEKVADEELTTGRVKGRVEEVGVREASNFVAI